MGASKKRGILGHPEDSEKTDVSLSQLGKDQLCEVDIQGVTAEFQSLRVNFKFHVGRARMAIGNPFKPVGDALKKSFGGPGHPPIKLCRGFQTVAGQHVSQPPLATFKWGAFEIPVAVALKACAAASDGKIVAG